MGLIDKLSTSNKGDNFRNKETPKKYADQIELLNKQTISNGQQVAPINSETIKKANKAKSQEIGN